MDETELIERIIRIKIRKLVSLGSPDPLERIEDFLTDEMSKLYYSGMSGDVECK